MKKIIRITSLAAATSLLVSLAGCGSSGSSAGGSSKDSSSGERQEITFLADANNTAQTAFEEMVNAYNEGQGAADGVYVNLKASAGVSTSGQNYFNQSGKSAPNVMMISDQVFRNYAIQTSRNTPEGMGYFANLNEYAAADTDLDLSAFPESLVDNFRLTFSETDKNIAGKGQDLLGLPFAGDMQVNYFNKADFEAAGINVISCEEDALASKYPNLQPHGYAEYVEAPFDGAVASTNLAGETVYKVFNNRIPMNWEESRYLYKCFTKEYNPDSPTTYGYVSEYWFNYAWSVGGDVVANNGTAYDFTLTDTTPNYLATKDVTVNGTAYKAGDLVKYADKTAAAGVDGLYELPSTYDALCEFLKLSVKSNQSIDAGISGYGISEPNVGNIVNGMMTGDTAMCRSYFSSLADSFSQSNAAADFDMFRSEQYREYVGGSTYQSGDGFNGEYLKVIGDTYDGEVYTGELKTENGTPIVGADTCASSSVCALVIPSNSDPDTWQASWDFISWAATEGQQYIAKSQLYIPAQSDVALGDTFTGDEAVSHGYDIWVAARNMQGYKVGDWGYFEDGSWVTSWSNAFNTEVRYGTMTVSDFADQYAKPAANATNSMLIEIVE